MTVRTSLRALAIGVAAREALAIRGTTLDQFDELGLHRFAGEMGTSPTALIQAVQQVDRIDAAGHLGTVRKVLERQGTPGFPKGSVVTLDLESGRVSRRMTPGSSGKTTTRTEKRMGGIVTYDTRTGKTTGLPERRSDVGVTWTGQGPDWMQHMLADPTASVWATVIIVEERLGLKCSGSRCERYERVQNRLAKLRKRSISGKLTDREDDLVDRYRRRLKAAEDAYTNRRRDAAEALSSLARQSTAVLHASRMGAAR